MNRSDTFSQYFQSNYSIEGIDPRLSEYNKVIEDIRATTKIRLSKFDNEFKLNQYISNSPDNVSKFFALNGAFKINPNNLEEKDLEVIEQTKLFKLYRGSYHTRSSLFYEFELTPSNGIETEYFDNLERKIKFTYNCLKSYQDSCNSNVAISFEQWQVLVGIFDNYNLFLSQLFNVVSFKSVVRKEQSGQLETLKKYYEYITRELYSLINGNKISKIIPLEFDFNSIKSELDSEKIKPIDREILREVPESNSLLFNNIWADALSQEILNEIPNLGTEMFLTGLHFGGIQMPYILQYKLKQLGYTNTKIVSCHYSSKNEYCEDEFAGLFDVEDVSIDRKSVV